MSEKAGGQLLETFCAAGGTLIDTAAAYGGGDSERLVGELIRTIPGRENVVVATKAGFVVRGGERIVDTSRRSLLSDLDGSLDRLGTDYVDLWQIHAWGSAPLEESLSAADFAVSSGKARYVGVSNFVGWQTAQGELGFRVGDSRAGISAARRGEGARP